MATQLQTYYPGNNDVLFSIQDEGGIFLVDTSQSSVTLYLPRHPPAGASFKIFDLSLNAASNNITVRTLYGELINGAPSLTINGNGDSAEIFREKLSENFIATITGTTSGGGGGGGGVSGAIRKYDTVGQMAAEPLYNQIVMFYARGLNAPGDQQGGGFYVWDAAETAPADGNQYVNSIFTGVGRFVKIM